MSPLAILSLARRYWCAPIIVGLWLAFLIQSDRVARKDAALKHAADVMALTTERINRGVAEARARDLANARRVEAAQDQARQETADALTPALAAARADAAAYARRLRLAEAAGGGGESAGMSAAAEPTGGVAGAGQTAELDAVACAEGVTKAEAWQGWWQRVQAIPR